MIKSFLCFSLLVFASQGAWAFSLVGPLPAYSGVPSGFGDFWEINQIGFNPLANSSAPPYILDPLLVGPKNLGEEYRRNTPVMYYACDASFLNYFGSNGMAAVDGAFNMLNNVFTNNPTGLTNGLDGYDTALSAIPLQALSLNYQAFGAGLLDLKSETLAMLMEQLGLADAIRYTWVIHNRYTGNSPGPCPVSYEYQVVMRNFDITASSLNQLQYSPYINGVFYNYYITRDLCDAPPAQPSVDAFEVATDPLASFYTGPVASGHGVDQLVSGYYYTGLTRDDVAGLRYLLSSNNILFESPVPGSVLIGSTSSGSTNSNSNYGPPYVLYTSNYTGFAQAALTNSPAALSNLFPGLIILSSSNYPVDVQTPNVIAYYTKNGSYGNGQVLIITTNGYTDTVVLHYVYTFANLFVTNSFLGRYYSSNSTAKLVTVQVQPNGSFGNGLVTNTTIQTIILTNVPTGDFFITTNLCGVNILYQLPYTNVVATTNVIVATSNSTGNAYSQSIITYSTNHAYWAENVICPGGGPVGVSNSVPGLYEGIEKIQFVRANYDSLVGQYFNPITNTFSMVMITNGQAFNQTLQRVVTAPDILLNARDLTQGNSTGNAINPDSRNINFDMANIPNGLAGPGTIIPATTITYNKSGPVFVNVALYFLNGTNNAARSFIWASFDGTTNDPVVYPNGTSIQNLENQILLQVTATPTVLPAATNGVPYYYYYSTIVTNNTVPVTYTTNFFAAPVVFSATGGQPPYTWSLATGSQLPLGLNLDPNSGILSGVPTNNPSGLQDFTIQLNDSAARTVLLNYFITF